MTTITVVVNDGPALWTVLAAIAVVVLSCVALYVAARYGPDVYERLLAGLSIVLIIAFYAAYVATGIVETETERLQVEALVGLGYAEVIVDDGEFTASLYDREISGRLRYIGQDRYEVKPGSSD